MGHCYRKGFGVVQNDQEAFKWNMLGYLYDEKKEWCLMRALAESGIKDANDTYLNNLYGFGIWNAGRCSTRAR